MYTNSFPMFLSFFPIKVTTCLNLTHIFNNCLYIQNHEQELLVYKWRAPERRLPVIQQPRVQSNLSGRTETGKINRNEESSLLFLHLLFEKNYFQFLSQKYKLTFRSLILNSNVLFQDDGNFVVYGWAPLWATNTGGIPGISRLAMQNDCNLVIYTPDKPVWASGTCSKNFTTCRLTLGNDGILVIHRDKDVVWKSTKN